MPSFSKIDFENAVRQAKDYIVAGEAIQIVLSQKFSGAISGEDFALYRNLRSVNPSPYMFYLKFGDIRLIGASPEILVRLTDGKIELRPIAGTRQPLWFRLGQTALHRSGVSIEVIDHLGPTIPILGVCLGHQAIATSYGAKIVRADRIMHGKTSRIFHDGRSVFKNLSNPFEAVCYHSLIVKKDTLPNCLEISAWTTDGEIMGLRHRKYPVEGVQFHPESILTETGKNILHNFSINGGKCDD